MGVVIRSGELDKVVTIKTVTKVADGMGGYTETDSDFLTGVRCAIWPVSASEIIKSEKMKMQVTHQIRMRYQAGVLSGMTILFGTRTFEIVSMINPEERNVRLDLLCSEDV